MKNQEKYWMERKGRAWIKVAKEAGANQELAEDSVRRLAMPAKYSPITKVTVLERIPVFGFWLILMVISIALRWPHLAVMFGSAATASGIQTLCRYHFWTPKWVFKKKVTAIVPKKRPW